MAANPFYDLCVAKPEALELRKTQTNIYRLEKGQHASLLDDVISERTFFLFRKLPARQRECSSCTPIGSFVGSHPNRIYRHNS